MRSTLPLNLRLLALPLSRPNGDPPRFLLHALRSSLASSTNDLPTTTRYLNKAINKAADLWAGLGKADGGWKKKTYLTGERLMDRIEWEEWALKSLDPALAPKLLPSLSAPSSSPSSSSGAPAPAGAGAGAPSSTATAAPLHAVATTKGRQPRETVELLYPPSLLPDEKALLDALKAQLDHREPHHRGLMYRCLILSPLTWPFAIIPVVPNLPLFYVLWRAWSHFRAWKATQYLGSLIGSPSLRLKASPELDEIYRSATPHAVGDLLLTPERVPLLVKRFRMTDEESKELERAVGQSESRLRQARSEAHPELVKSEPERVKKD
ncbi:hypothetical protein JCM3775_002523 [Rhodotorula graminis]|uniref:Mitochondrial K+-H+ exchange-related-domain-containing protein n=1 Tax=Rhodotorula graminis (strain WP1) TaxID=578459 RepID=A0A0P9FBS5_RHOGW|nr:uncharacterized protein RHOBADRAFT_55305 [Rhodotorula graminis WP1]KPV73072.1 hypothetical protein RHOBADRAFT_55305 [Rhodotorula graminis WP1]